MCIVRWAGCIDRWSAKRGSRGGGATRRLWSVFPGSLLVMLMVQAGARGFFANETDSDERLDQTLRSHLQRQEVNMGRAGWANSTRAGSPALGHVGVCSPVCVWGVCVTAWLCLPATWRLIFPGGLGSAALVSASFLLRGAPGAQPAWRVLIGMQGARSPVLPLDS